MNEEERKKYYARLEIKPPSPAAVVVRNDEVESAIPERPKEKILLTSEVAATKQVESVTDHKSTSEEIRDAQVIELKEDEGDRRGQIQELRGQLKKPEAEDLARAEVVETADRVEGAAEGNLRDSAGDQTAPESTLFQGSKAADELEPQRATLAAATVLPLSLLSSKKAWLWAVVLFCVAIAVYLLIRWYSGRGESISPQKEEPQTVEEFMRDS